MQDSLSQNGKKKNEKKKYNQKQNTHAIFKYFKVLVKF